MFNENHLSVRQVAKIWGVSAKTISRIFKNERGVVDLGQGYYSCLRIPETVMKRVHMRLAAA